MTGSPGGRLCARAGVGATATVGVTAIANAVSSASACAAGVLRRTLIVLPAVNHVRSGPRAQCSANLVAPPSRVNASRDHVSVHVSLPRAWPERSGRMRQQRGKALTRCRMASENLAMMLDSARAMMTPSARSDVPPFMVMDVMAAAARIEAAGGKVIHMEVGQPAVGRAVDRGCGGAGRARQERARLHRVARHSLAARAHRAALCRDLSRAGECRPRDRDHRLVGRIHPGVSGDVRAGRPRRDRQSGLSAVSAHPDRARLRAGADRDRRRDALCHHRRKPARRAREEAARRRAGRKPGQSDRHHDDARTRLPR